MTAAPAAPVREPAFWFGFEVSWAKLCVARVVLFGLLAVDAFLQIRHAPRYGAGGFNVGQLPLLDGIGPGRVGYEVGQLLASYLFVLAALGVATRAVVPMSAALYGWLYFGSQLDSYQHHYLVWLVLVIASFVPWRAPADAEPHTPVRSWALRLVLVQLAIMYLWAAISKLDPAWLDGRTLATQLSGVVRSAVDRTVGIRAAAVMVVGLELVLAATIWLRPAWRIAAPLGILFHLGIAASGFEIGLFAYLMLGLYVLVLPDALWSWLAERSPLRDAVRRLATATSWIAGLLGVAAGLVLAWLLRLEHGWCAALVATSVPVALVVHARIRRARPSAMIGVAHAAAIALWLLADRASSVAVDYYRFWGGSQRRLGQLETAERAYRGLIEVAPDNETGHYQLGRLLLASDRAEQGLAALHQAQHLEPSRARAYVEEARWLARNGRLDEALAKARQATFAEPGHADAARLLDSLQSQRPAPAADSADDDTEPTRP